MSATLSKGAALDARGPGFVFVRPQLGENIGACARAMLNFGVLRMLLVAPRDGWPNPVSTATASGAGRILDSAEVYRDLPSALETFHYVFATTARKRDIVKPVFNPEEAMQEARARIAGNQRVAVMYGPERAGLENSDLVHANAIVEVPANPEFKSLNISQCALLLGYEWMRSAVADCSAPGPARPETAKLIAKQKLVHHFVEDLTMAGYFWPEEKAQGMKLNLTNMIMRLELTEAEVRTLHGVRNSLRRYAPQTRS